MQDNIYVGPLLFPWLRSGPPTFLILESPLYATLKIPDVCTTIFLENMPQPQATNCRTLNKKYCIVLKHTFVT